MHLLTLISSFFLVSFSFTVLAIPITVGPSAGDINEFLKTIGGIAYNGGNDANEAAKTGGDIAYNGGKVAGGALDKAA